MNAHAPGSVDAYASKYVRSLPPLEAKRMSSIEGVLNELAARSLPFMQQGDLRLVASAAAHLACHVAVSGREVTRGLGFLVGADDDTGGRTRQGNFQDQEDVRALMEHVAHTFDVVAGLAGLVSEARAWMDIREDASGQPHTDVERSRAAGGVQ